MSFILRGTIAGLDSLPETSGDHGPVATATPHPSALQKEAPIEKDPAASPLRSERGQSNRRDLEYSRRRCVQPPQLLFLSF